MKTVGLLVLWFLSWDLGAVPLAASTTDPSVSATIKQTLTRAFPALVIDSIEKSPVSDLYQITFGSRIAYATPDGRYVLMGDALDLQASPETRNITESLRAKIRVILLRGIPETQMIVYRPKIVKSVVIIYTDSECGYCQDLHREINKLTNLGIEVRYLAFPRQGMGSPGYTNWVSVWCASDRVGELTQAMQGKAIAARTCEHPIDKHMALIGQLGLTGTPTIIFEDGMMAPGYLPAETLASEAIKHSVKD